MTEQLTRWDLELIDLYDAFGQTFSVDPDRASVRLKDIDRETAVKFTTKNKGEVFNFAFGEYRLFETHYNEHRLKLWLEFRGV